MNLRNSPGHFEPVIKDKWLCKLKEFNIIFFKSYLHRVFRPGFSIGNQNQGPILVSQPIFFPQTETFLFQFFFKLQIFLIFAHFLEDTSFNKLENKPRSSKTYSKNLMFGRKFGFRGPYMMEKNTSCHWLLNSPS